MKRTFGILLMALLMTAFLAGGAFAFGGKNQGKTAGAQKNGAIPAPALAGDDVLGRSKFDLSKQKGKVVFVNFWATWCPPCKAEIPDLVKLSEKYKDKLVIVGVSLDKDGPEVVKPFVKDLQMSYPVIMGSAEVAELWGGIEAIPTSYVIGKDGNVIGKIVGMRDYDGLEGIIKPLL